MLDWNDLGTKEKATYEDLERLRSNYPNLPEEDKATYRMLVDTNAERINNVYEPYTIDDMTTVLKNRGYEWRDEADDDAKADFVNYLNNTFVNEMLDSWNTQKSFPWGTAKSIDDMTRDAMLDAWADAVIFDHSGQYVENIDDALSANDDYFDTIVNDELSKIVAPGRRRPNTSKINDKEKVFLNAVPNKDIDNDLFKQLASNVASMRY